MLAPAVVMMNINGWRRAPMPVCIVTYRSSASCSWYSSTIAHDGDEPSPGLPMIGSNRLPSSGRFKLPAFTSMPSKSFNSAVRLTISRAGRKTSQACFSVVAPLYTSAPNSPSAQNIPRPTPAAMTLLPFLRGTSQYDSRKRRMPSFFRTQPNVQARPKSCQGSSVIFLRWRAHSPLVWGRNSTNRSFFSALAWSNRYG